jgi:hypothetical protein
MDFVVYGSKKLIVLEGITWMVCMSKFWGCPKLIGTSCFEVMNDSVAYWKVGWNIKEFYWWCEAEPMAVEQKVYVFYLCLRCATWYYIVPSAVAYDICTVTSDVLLYCSRPLQTDSLHLH